MASSAARADEADAMFQLFCEEVALRRHIDERLCQLPLSAAPHAASRPVVLEHEVKVRS